VVYGIIGGVTKMSKTKIFLSYFLIILTSNGGLREANATCTNLIIQKSGNQWSLLGVWYTPCGQQEETPGPFYVGPKGNSVSIEPGTRVRIGPGQIFLDRKMSGAKVTVECSGSKISDKKCEVVK